MTRCLLEARRKECVSSQSRQKDPRAAGAKYREPENIKETSGVIWSSGVSLLCDSTARSKTSFKGRIMNENGLIHLGCLGFQLTARAVNKEGVRLKYISTVFILYGCERCNELTTGSSSLENTGNANGKILSWEIFRAQVVSSSMGKR